MSSWARVGVKCVCIDDHPTLKNGAMTRHLVSGRVYVVASVQSERLIDYRTGQLADCTTVKLVGVNTRTGYWTARFRPLVPPKAKTQADDVALIKSLLTPAPELVE